jgi:hypothetical protein
VRVDKDTLSDQDLTTVLRMLDLRPMQFCMFLRGLMGPEVMERKITEAIEVAKNLGDN